MADRDHAPAPQFHPRRILAVQLADIGDLVLTLPALHTLREGYPDATIDLLTTPQAAPVVAHARLEPREQTAAPANSLPLVNSVYTVQRGIRRDHLIEDVQAWAKLFLQLRRGQYDAVLFFHHLSTRAGVAKYAAIAVATAAPLRFGLDNGLGTFLTHRVPDKGYGTHHQADYALKVVQRLRATLSPDLYAHELALLSPADRAWAAALPTVGQGRRVVIHAGSGGYSLARRWEAEKFARVADALAADGHQIVLVGGKGDDADAVRAALAEPTRARLLDLSNQTTLGQLMALLATADLFIGADSGVMHLAALMGARVLALFGPSNAEAWRPYTEPGRSTVVRSGVECSPCSYVGYGVGARNGCAARTCMRLITPESVTAHARAMLAALPDSRNTAVQAEAQVEQRQSVPHDWGGAGWGNAISILGFPVSRITYEDWLQQIGAWVQSATSCQHVCTINPEFIMIARRDPIFSIILKRCALTVSDGVGLLWAARRMGTPLPQRVTGSDGVPIIAERAAREGWRLFLLGAAPGVAEKAAEVLRARFPGLHIVGVYSGSPAWQEEDAIVEQVNRSNADILFVAYGAPEQDKWIARNLPRLSAKMAMGVGGSFDFIAGIVPRAPLFMQRSGLEWLYRLYLQPWRVRRMMRLPRFVLAVLWEARRE